MWFKRIINERVRDPPVITLYVTQHILMTYLAGNHQEENLEDPQFMTIKDMEKYAENTASCLLYLQLESLKIRDVTADHIVSHIGKAIGIATLLRALPFHTSQKRLILPAEVTAKVNIHWPIYALPTEND
jgi:phytoene/squalene synthetase